ncbi:MAG: RHS repeat-associated core domain-containing protein [Desulfobacteraceae bacterium]|nr:RHS repeat-associated core domain-containing protein [Desulfobacteraceae bacterium]
MPFGEDRDTNSLLATSAYKFTDQEQDDGTGLYNYDARLYDPVLGQFVMADSIVPDLYNPQSLNRYAYCLNNPLIYTDPSGNIFVSGSIAVGYSAYVVGGLIASGIVYYGTPIAADLGKKIGNWWAEKKNKIERDEEGRTRREPNDRDKGHDHGSQGEALEDALDMWDVDDPETEDIKPDHSRENGKGPNGEPMENIGYILNFRG